MAKFLTLCGAAGAALGLVFGLLIVAGCGSGQENLSSCTSYTPDVGISTAVVQGTIGPNDVVTVDVTGQGFLTCTTGITVTIGGQPATVEDLADTGFTAIATITPSTQTQIVVSTTYNSGTPGGSRSASTTINTQAAVAT